MLTWLADVLRAAGLRVDELDGWRTRGRGIDPQGVVWHHTATPRSASDANVARLLRDGRSDLPGPLSQLGLRRDGTFVVVAAGRSNHNGLAPIWGNDSIGIEAYNDGVGEPWPKVQVDAYVSGTAAICRHLGWGADRVKAHRETDPGRKVDPRGLDMHAARARVTAALNQEDTMTPEQEARILAAIKDRSGLIVNTVNQRTGMIYNAVRAAQVDAGALAEELAIRLPSTSGPVRVEDLKTALVEVLGSLDE